jgi:hypothetical protein
MGSRQLRFPAGVINYFHVTFQMEIFLRCGTNFLFFLTWRMWNTINLSVMAEGCCCETWMRAGGDAALGAHEVCDCTCPALMASAVGAPPDPRPISWRFGGSSLTTTVLTLVSVAVPPF